ncbi:hypothetical protein HETIRDRAFT_164157 [Heterobasidion irregulare TC 32-1]|uniref:Uncharacterized protein n=1 Tax=Heterobasidion irregulare (strain TC 32-1) TaxID=747525 RepID=W4JX94_HETIT|nr:uncharacterized protein HETIRDRAFT_164157 [Heterobasidion irregulare TC 32-1]ETW78182.1 hypothetical protein HETIRDRAFT_164157 [Heterobasidion irregulare TC 32-1]
MLFKSRGPSQLRGLGATIEFKFRDKCVSGINRFHHFRGGLLCIDVSDVRCRAGWCADTLNSRSAPLRVKRGARNPARTIRQGAYRNCVLHCAPPTPCESMNREPPGYISACLSLTSSVHACGRSVIYISHFLSRMSSSFRSGREMPPAQHFSQID